MTKKRFTLISLFFVLFLFKLAAQPTLKTINQLQDTINKIMTYEHQSSLMLAIVTKDSILFSNGFGFANIETKQKATTQTLFPMASITKTFTALAIMNLVKQGKLSLYDDLSKIAPEIIFTNQWEKSNPIKIIHLLEHTSGFDDLRFNTFWNNENNLTELQAIEKCKNSMHARWKPGERKAYSNIGYNILGYLIEKISGSTYEDYLKNEILLPIGMTNSSFSVPSQSDTLYSIPYEWKGTKYEKLPYLLMYGKGAGALYSCATDMAKFVQFMIRNGINDSLPSLNSVIEEMEIPESSTPATLGLKTGYGKGVNVDFLSYKYPFYGHDGASIGFNSRYAYNRALQLGYVICATNTGFYDDDIIVKYLTQTFQAGKAITTVSVKKEILKSYEGFYQLKSPRFEILDTYLEELFHGYHVELRGDSLYSYGFKRPDRVMLPVTSTIFKKPKDNLPSFLFTTNDKGKKVMYEWGAYYERTSYPKILIFRVLVLGSLVCGILLFLSSIFWLFKALFKKLSWTEYFRRSVSAFGVLSLILAFASLAYLGTKVPLMGTVNFYTVTFCIGTILFAFLSITGFIMTIKRFRNITNKWTKWYLLITTTWLLALVVFYFHYDWIGLRMWSY